jgi:hypothetical protein
MKLLNQPLLVEWHKFKPGTSIFIPCINRRAMEKEVLAEVRRLQVPVICKHVVERGIYGLRVWNADAIVDPHSSLTPPERT